MDKKGTLKGFFVCDKCRSLCKDGCDSVGLYGPNSCVFAYYPRKQFIKCLGPYCDTPCKLKQKESDLTIDQLIKLTMFLTDELNKVLITEK